VSTSAFEACQQHWPQLFATMVPAEQQRVMAGLRQARPVLEDDRFVGSQPTQGSQLLKSSQLPKLLGCRQ
jgi:hypothetical protein